MTTPFNPWATRKVASRDTPNTPIGDKPEYAAAQTMEYAAPSLESGSPYNDELGWSNRSLRPSTVEYPSAQRLQTVPTHDMRPNAVRPPEEHYERLDADDKARHSVEWQDADGHATTVTTRRFAPNPRSTPPPENRWTQRLSPSTYRFTRPFDQGYERQLNGNHFSMADHRRTYEIGGMAPVRTLRNTYRLEPAPWDANIVDMPPASEPIDARRTGQTVPGPSRSWRL